MNTQLKILAVILALAVFPLVIAATYDDGASHDITEDRGDVTVKNDTTVNILDGAIVDCLWTQNGSTVNVSGGRIKDSINTGENSSLNISGGKIKSVIWAYEDSKITITGKEFNLEPGEISGSEGTITGTLLDGSKFRCSFYKFDNAVIEIVVK